MYIGDGACATDCQKALWVMRQTRQLLAEDMSRVQRVFLAETGCCNREFLAREHVGLDVVRADAAAAATFIAQFPRQDAPHTIYVIDPLGNLMMRFDARQNPKGLLTDLEKLLKLSHIG